MIDLGRRAKARLPLVLLGVALGAAWLWALAGCASRVPLPLPEPIVIEVTSCRSADASM